MVVVLLFQIVFLLTSSDTLKVAHAYMYNYRLLTHKFSQLHNIRNRYKNVHLSMTMTTTSSNPIMANNNYNILSNLKEILCQYDYYIIDQWGVLHNGKVPYQGKSSFNYRSIILLPHTAIEI